MSPMMSGISVARINNVGMPERKIKEKSATNSQPTLKSRVHSQDENLACLVRCVTGQYMSFVWVGLAPNTLILF